MKDVQSRKEDDNILKLNCKKMWQMGMGHWTSLKGAVHTDKRSDKPGKGGRKQDQIRKQMED